ncbi:resistin-like beta [Erinaceus europaeus]|uniref:Resistin-like beta n=1 Tax=Erinaceus europaeus TaxID=9365 RepID=A0A1S2ZNS5_ERIEU|nr:resistin-like beta [Erinaceus europaeus]
MKSTACFMLTFILLLQLIISGSNQCSLESVVDKKVMEILNNLEINSSPKREMSCTSVTNSGKLSTCPAGTVVTGCACGYGCGSWDVQSGNTCHCQCSGMDWTTARCCRLT